MILPQYKCITGRETSMKGLRLSVKSPQSPYRQVDSKVVAEE
uniref:Uncharacterized protein n=1 Tax=Setaria italica TaxID=4555 RepID=K3Z187_SETIT